MNCLVNFRSCEILGVPGDIFEHCRVKQKSPCARSMMSVLMSVSYVPGGCKESKARPVKRYKAIFLYVLGQGVVAISFSAPARRFLCLTMVS